MDITNFFYNLYLLTSFDEPEELIDNYFIFLKRVFKTQYISCSILDSLMEMQIIKQTGYNDISNLCIQDYNKIIKDISIKKDMIILDKDKNTKEIIFPYFYLNQTRGMTIFTVIIDNMPNEEFLKLGMILTHLILHIYDIRKNRDELSKSHSMMSNRLNELITLDWLNSQVASSTDVIEIIEKLLQGIKQAFGFNETYLYLFNEYQTRIVLQNKLTRSDKAFIINSKEFYNEKDSFVYEMLNSKEKQIFNRESKNITKIDKKIVSIAKANNFVFFPIKIQNTILGFVLIAYDNNVNMSLDTIANLEKIISNSALFIDNALLHERLKRKSITDTLSGLYNHGFFQEKLAAILEEARKIGFFCSLLMVDIDFFKKFNDTYGHQTGDKVIKLVAAVLSENAGKNDIVCRYGGEEFTLILPKSDVKNAKKLAEILRIQVKNVNSYLKLNDSINISIGISTFKPGENKNKEHLIKESDSALYFAKEHGRDRIIHYDDIPANNKK